MALSVPYIELSPTEGKDRHSLDRLNTINESPKNTKGSWEMVQLAAGSRLN